MASIQRKKRRTRGYILITTALSAVSLISMVGVALDLGRMYLARSEGQVYADSAALSGVLELDGTSQGIDDARQAIAANLNRWYFSTKAFTGTTVEFATAAGGPWVASPIPATGHRFVRVSAEGSVNLLFVPVLGNYTSATVRSRGVAGQVPKTQFREALFPFSPYQHSNVPPNFGLSPGQDYTLRWPTNPDLGHGSHTNLCPGDRTQAMVDLAQAASGSERGFIEETSASSIRATIVADKQTVFRSIGDLVDMSGGAKQTELDSLHVRILQDTDSSSLTYAEYLRRGQGNGRRVIACPINDGGTPPGSNNRIVGIGSFFLHGTGEYGNGGNQAWCAEYVGPWLQGSVKQAVGDGVNGAFVARLVE